MNVSFDGQTYKCLTPKWPEEKCEMAKESKHRNGQCMFLMDDNRCDNIENVQLNEAKPDIG